MSSSQEKPVFLIAGGTGSVGKVLTGRLIESGATVVIGGRNSEKLQALKSETGAETVSLDALESGSIQNAIADTAKQFGRLDGVANCIGSVLLKPAHLTSDEDFQQTLKVNLHSCFEVVRGAAKAMRQSGGSVVLFSTAAAAIGIPSHEAIAAAKSGIEGLARSAAATYARSGIRFNVIAPGLVRSEMSRDIWDNETAAAASLEMHALDRFGEPRDIAAMAAFLLDPENDWMTGQVVGLDGGLSRVLPRTRR